MPIRPFAKAARQRRDNLQNSKSDLVGQREGRRSVAVREGPKTELEKAELLESRDSRGRDQDGSRRALIGLIAPSANIVDEIRWPGAPCGGRLHGALLLGIMREAPEKESNLTGEKRGRARLKPTLFLIVSGSGLIAIIATGVVLVGADPQGRFS